MRHGVASNHFNRDTNQRKSLFKNLVIELIEHGSLTTTGPRAKEIRRISDRLIHKAQTDSLTVRRTLHRFFGRRDVVNTLIERVAPAVSSEGRVSGFTRLVSAGNRRGDNSPMMTLSLVNQPDRVGTVKSGRDHAVLRTASAAKKSVKKDKEVKAVEVAKPIKVARPDKVVSTPKKATPKVKVAATKKVSK